jgi:hypothetical protein
MERLRGGGRPCSRRPRNRVRWNGRADRGKQDGRAGSAADYKIGRTAGLRICRSDGPPRLERVRTTPARSVRSRTPKADPDTLPTARLISTRPGASRNPPSSPPCRPTRSPTRPPASTPTTRSARRSRPSRSTRPARSSSTTLSTWSTSCGRERVRRLGRSCGAER